MTVIFKAPSFFLLDHGSSLCSTSSHHSPIPGLFHQPKQYFKSRTIPTDENHTLTNLFRSIGYPNPGQHEATDHPQKRRKVSSETHYSWTNAGTVVSHKNSVFAEESTKSRDSPVVQFEVVINNAISHSDHVVIPEVSVKYHSLFNRYSANKSERSMILRSGSQSFILPPHSSFLMSDITHVNSLVSFAPSSRYPFIVMDPPWSNKSIRRSRHYQTLSTHSVKPPGEKFNRSRKYEEIGYMFDRIPIPHLLNPHHGVLAIWITNNVSHIAHVVNVLFPSWGLELLKVVFWLKVTNNGEPILPFHSPHKKPYELLFIAADCHTCNGSTENQRVFGSEDIDDLIAFPFNILGFPENTSYRDDEGSPVPSGEHQLPPQNEPPNETKIDKLVIASIPCVQHSRKPTLDKLLAEICRDNTTTLSQSDPNGRGLELFARSLNEGWVSWGNEVLLFQDTQYFTSQ